MSAPNGDLFCSDGGSRCQQQCNPSHPRLDEIDGVCHCETIVRWVAGFLESKQRAYSTDEERDKHISHAKPPALQSAISISRFGPVYNRFEFDKQPSNIQ